MTKPRSLKAVARRINPFLMRPSEEFTKLAQSEVHVYAKHSICDTEKRGHKTPQNRSPAEIVLDASSGFIPLWASDTTLRWRFQSRSINHFEDPEAACQEIRDLLTEAVLLWGEAVPIKFAEREDAWDFEIVVRDADRCTDDRRCVLASAFFPDAGQHEFVIYPQMFTQSREEQIDTFAHEIGHIFGLRHFFANISETKWPSEIFGKHVKFSIMNYGHDSELTDADKRDLRNLYLGARSGQITNINGTPIRLVRPFSTIRISPVLTSAIPANAPAA